MDKKDSKLLEEQFWINDPESENFRTPEQVETELKERKKVYDADTREERKSLTFEERYKETKPLFFYEKNAAQELYDKIGFLGIVLPSDLDAILTIGIYNAHKNQDIEFLKNALHTKNRLKYGMILSTHKSYNHSGQFEQVIDAFADCDLDLVKKYLPEKFGPADKNSNPFLRTGSNLIMSMLYKNENWLTESTELAEKFNNQKSSSKNDVLVIEYLMALSQQNTERASALLQDIANAYKKTSWLFNFKNQFLKFFGVYVHGLYHIAYYVLPGNKFAEIKTPEHTVFWKEFDEYTKGKNFQKGQLNLNLSDNIDELNRLFE